MFASFPTDRIEALCEETAVRELARREHWLMDETDDRVYVVGQGGVKLCRNSALGRRLVEGILARGDVFGTLNIGDDEVPSAP